MSVKRVPQVAPAGNRKMEGFAAQVAAKLDCYPGGKFKPIDVPRLMEIVAYSSYGLQVYVKDLDGWVEGITLPGNPGTLYFPTTIYERLVDEALGRDRFTGMHEFCHGILHAPQLTDTYLSFNPSAGQLYRRSELPAYVDPEWQANKFAAFILMPKWAMMDAIKQHGPNVRTLADMFQVSQHAMRIRLGELGYPS